MENLQEGLVEELNRNRELKKMYEELPSGAGKFASSFIQQAIDAGDKALASGDVVEMVKAYKELESSK